MFNASCGFCTFRRCSRSFRDVKLPVLRQVFSTNGGWRVDMTIFWLQRNFTIFLPLNVVILIQVSIQAPRLNSFPKDTKESLVFLLELREEHRDYFMESARVRDFHTSW